MPKYADFRQKAERCRELLRKAAAPEVKEQLKMWVREFEEQMGAGNLEPAFLKRMLTNGPN
jgi:hypothetical protein